MIDPAHHGSTHPLTGKRAIAAVAKLVALVVFTIGTLPMLAQTYTVLYRFQGQADGGFPDGGLLRDAAGNLYGSTDIAGILTDCGNYGCGTVYKLTANGQFSVLHSFTGRSDGQNLNNYSSMIQDSQGNLYDLTSNGGAGNNGLIYRMSPTGAELVLHTFPSSPNDGLGPQFTLYRDANTGVIYGTTFAGGAHNYGTVFAVPKAGVSNDVILHSFGGADGSYPQAGVVSDAAGNLYGTTGSGAGCGTVFKMTRTGGNFTVLHHFTCAPDGFLPGPVILDAQGNIYGGTLEGGDSRTCPAFGCGIIFKLSPSGQETILHTFRNTEGSTPNELMFDSQGNLWGTTAFGGAHNNGVIFEITSDGTYIDRYDFLGGANGGVPYSGLIQDPQGNFYGTVGGGVLRCVQSGCGMIYKFTP